MKLVNIAALGAALALMGGGMALAEDCCKDGKPCCEKNEKGELPPCCAKHDHDGPKTETPAPETSQPDAPQPAPEHEHHHHQ